MKTRIIGTAVILFVGACGICDAQVVVKQEPLDMRNGATVLVDDGTCGKGKIKLVTVTHGNAMPGALRARQNAFRDEAQPPPVRCPLRRGSFKRFNAAADWRVVGGNQEQPCLDVGPSMRGRSIHQRHGWLIIAAGLHRQMALDGRMRDQNQESLA
jgi:hypothetical protein